MTWSIAAMFGHEDGDLDDVIEPAAGVAEHGGQVREDLAALSVEVVASDGAALLVDGGLPGDEDQVPT